MKLFFIADFSLLCFSMIFMALIFFDIGFKMWMVFNAASGYSGRFSCFLLADLFMNLNFYKGAPANETAIFVIDNLDNVRSGVQVADVILPSIRCRGADFNYHAGDIDDLNIVSTIII